VIGDEMAAVLALLDHPDWARRGAVALGVDGLSVTLTLEGSGPAGEVLCCSSPLSRRFEDLQCTLGQGPTVEVVRSGSAALVWDLRQDQSHHWGVLPAEAELLPVRAAFSFPLGIGAIQLGALTAVRSTPGVLTGAQTQDALALAAALTARYLDHWDPPQTLYRPVVHQAVGMLSVQLVLPLAEALLRLRAYAYRSRRPISDVSHDIATRRLRLDTDGSGNALATEDED
jgi:hypothetical protein